MKIKTTSRLLCDWICSRVEVVYTVVLLLSLRDVLEQSQTQGKLLSYEDSWSSRQDGRRVEDNSWDIATPGWRDSYSSITTRLLVKIIVEISPNRDSVTPIYFKTRHIEHMLYHPLMICRWKSTLWFVGENQDPFKSGGSLFCPSSEFACCLGTITDSGEAFMLCWWANILPSHPPFLLDALEIFFCSC